MIDSLITAPKAIANPDLWSPLFISSLAPIISIQAITVELVEVLVALLRLHQIGNIVTRTFTPG